MVKCKIIVDCSCVENFINEYNKFKEEHTQKHMDKLYREYKSPELIKRQEEIRAYLESIKNG